MHALGPAELPQRTNRSRTLALVLTVAALACRHPHYEGPTPAVGLAEARPDSIDFVTFTNRRTEPVTVYIASETGAEYLLGRVSPLRTVTLRLPHVMPQQGMSAYVVVVPMGSWHPFSPRKAVIRGAILSVPPEPIEDLLVKRWDLAGGQLAGFIK